MASTRKTANGGEVSRLRLRVQAYEPRVLDSSMKQVLEAAVRFDVEVSGPIPLPTKIKKYSVNRAPFVFKTSQDQYEMRVHTRVLDIKNPTPQVIESLSNLSLPVGVSVEVKML